MVSPGGRYIQRFFESPSDQSGYCGEKWRFRGSTTPG
jgi:hypothetical protein